MSSTKTAQRRLSLMAGSSLVAASLSAAASLGAALTPSVALAYDECVPTPATGTLTDGAGGVSDPTLNGPAADSFSCAAASYPSGITYSSNGDLTVTKSASGTTTIGGAGINLTGNGSDATTWVSTAGSVTAAAGLTGPLIDVTSGSGKITVSTAAVTANVAGATHAVRAVSTGGGDIEIMKTANQFANNNVEGGYALYEARTNGGNISIQAPGGGTSQARQRGVLAETSGAGSISIVINHGITASAIDGISVVDLTAGTGGINLTKTSAFNGGAGKAIVANSTGAITMTLSANTIGRTGTIVANAGGPLTMTIGGNVTSSDDGGAILANAGGPATITLNSGTINGGGGDAIRLSASGGVTITNNASTIGSQTGGGRIDLSGSTGGGVTFTNGSVSGSPTGRWIASGASRFTGFDDVLVMAGTGMFGFAGLLQNALLADGSIDFGAGNDSFFLHNLFTTENATLDFGSGEDLFENSGILAVQGLLDVQGLEVFNNSGRIHLGGLGGIDFFGTISDTPTNGQVGDILRIPGAAFHGSGASLIVMDVNLGAGGQLDCSTAAAADCVDISGGSTSGFTLLKIMEAGSVSGSGASSRTALIVGSSAEDNFAIDPASPGAIETDQGFVLRKRLFDFYLLYDAEAQMHVLQGVPHIEAFQVTTFAAGAQDIWRATTGSWFDRQADLRATPGGLEPSGGLWARAGVGLAERDFTMSQDVLNVTIENDIQYEQRIAHVVFGADLLGAATQGASWVVGATVGLARGDTTYSNPEIEAVYAGASGGFYASWLSGPIFLDGAMNLNVVDLSADVPSLGLGEGVKLTQTIRTAGARAEGGWRIGMGGGGFVEPLASVAYISSKLDRVDVPGNSGTFEFGKDPESLRVGAGMRAGLDGRLMGVAASYSLTGRYMSELMGENSATLAGNSPTTLTDNFSGDFGELVGSVNLYSRDGGVSGFLNLGGKFGDGYEAVDGAVGVRVRW